MAINMLAIRSRAAERDRSPSGRSLATYYRTRATIALAEIAQCLHARKEGLFASKALTSK